MQLGDFLAAAHFAHIHKVCFSRDEEVRESKMGLGYIGGAVVAVGEIKTM